MVVFVLWYNLIERGDIMKILVTGGAGYIGSHTTLELIKSGHEVVVFDNLSTGNKEAIHPSAKFYKGDTLVFDDLDEVMKAEKVDAVIHFAAKLIVSESVAQPDFYYWNNVGGVANLIKAMANNGVKNIVFSSTAAVYGSCEDGFVTENAKLDPQSPYGQSKMMAERVIIDSNAAYGINYSILRYFNVAGADSGGKIGLAPSNGQKLTHLIPTVVEAAQGKRAKIQIFGSDYDTKDGTCVRDYIHVTDLALAHIKALEWMTTNNSSDIFNLGSSEGFSVYEVVREVEATMNVDVPYEFGPRRPGDAVTVVADAKKANTVLNWKPKEDLSSIIKSDWEWRSKNPNGFKKED